MTSKIIGFFQSIASKADSVLTTKGDLATYSSTRIREGVGTNNKTLMADSAQATGIKWAPSSTSVLTTAGDLLVASGANALTRLARGSDNYVLTMNGTSLNWEAASAGVSLSADNTWTGNQNVNAFISSTPTELTISSGSITATRSTHIVDTEGEASSDTLTHMRGEGYGRIVILASANSARDITLDDEAGGNGTLNMAGDFSLDNYNDTISFIGRFSDGATFMETSRSDNDP